MTVEDELLRCTGFDWDDANAPKIWGKHRVSPMECEQVFFNVPLDRTRSASMSLASPTPDDGSS
jgi:hypothetical protein